MQTNRDLLNSFYLAFLKQRMTVDEYRELIAKEINDAMGISHKQLHADLMQLKEVINNGKIR